MSEYSGKFVPRTSFALASAAIPSASLIPRMSGTTTNPLPATTRTSMTVFSGTSVSLPGDCERIVSTGWSDEVTRSTTCTRRPRPSAMGIASASVSVVRLGTLTLLSGPLPAEKIRSAKITPPTRRRAVRATPPIAKSMVLSDIVSPAPEGFSSPTSFGSGSISGSPGPASAATRATRVPARARGAPAAGPTGRDGTAVRFACTT